MDAADQLNEVGLLMKDVLTKLLAWWAFIHLITVALAYGHELYPYRLPDLMHEFLSTYLQIFPWLLIKFWFPGFMWLALFLFTGRPRVLPWK